MQRTIYLTEKLSLKQVVKGISLFLFINFSVAGLAGLITSYSLNNWYDTLGKPSWQPDNSVFSPVWTTLYFMMSLAGYYLWKAKNHSHYLYYIQTRPAFQLYWIQLGLNFLWTVFFFGLKSPFLALMDIVILWIILIIAMINFYPISKKATVLFIPYFLWVTFAGFLNLAIWNLNPQIRLLTLPFTH